MCVPAYAEALRSPDCWGNHYVFSSEIQSPVAALLLTPPYCFTDKPEINLYCLCPSPSPWLLTHLYLFSRGNSTIKPKPKYIALKKTFVPFILGRLKVNIRSVLSSNLYIFGMLPEIVFGDTSGTVVRYINGLFFHMR